MHSLTASTPTDGIVDRGEMALSSGTPVNIQTRCKMKNSKEDYLRQFILGTFICTSKLKIPLLQEAAFEAKQ